MVLFTAGARARDYARFVTTLLLAALVTVSSLVVDDTGVPLPGVTVTLSNGTLTRTAVTNEHGRYTFAGVREGTYDFRYQLSGLQASEQRSHTDRVPVQTMSLSAEIEMVTMACGRCSSEPPATPYALPLCADADMNDTLLEAAAKGDRSALALLRTRFAQTTSLAERHRIGAALLDDSAVWDELFSRAKICLRFPLPDGSAYPPAFLQWCDAHGVPPEIWSASYDALRAISGDARGRPLLREALRSEDWSLACAAIAGLAEQRDESSLPAIEETLRRFPDHAAYMATALSGFAGEVAKKYLEEEQQ